MYVLKIDNLEQPFFKTYRPRILTCTCFTFHSVHKKYLLLDILLAGYFAVNVLGVWFYNVTPIIVYFYRVYQGQDVSVGFVWVSWYPFDKHQPLAHIFVYIFEIFAGK